MFTFELERALSLDVNRACSNWLSFTTFMVSPTVNAYHLIMRSKVLALFRSLHRTRQSIFQGDEVALNAARKKINDEFRENKDETDPDEIKHMIKIGQDVELLMKKTIVQAKLNEKGRYEVRVTEDTLREDNAPLPKRNAPKMNKTENTTTEPR